MGHGGFGAARALDPLVFGDVSTRRGECGGLPARNFPCTLTYMEVESIEMKTADVRHELAEVVNAAATRNRITYITNRGRRIAAVVPLHVAEQAEQKK